MANEPRYLFELEDFFDIIINGQVTPIDEPVGFNSIRVKAVRDKELYGFNYEFIDNSVNLTFVFTEGGELIRQKYEAEGADGEIFFQYGYYQKGEKKVQFIGQVNLNQYEVTDEGVSVQVEKTPFEQLLRTRSEVKVSLTQTKDYNDAPVVPPSPLKIRLHSRRIKKYAKALSTTEVFDAEYFGLTDPAQGNAVWFQPDTTNLVNTELSEMFSLPLSVTKFTPFSEDRFQFEAQEFGIATFRFFGSFMYTRKNHSLARNIDNLKLQPFIQVWRNGAMFQEFQPEGQATKLNAPTQFSVVNLPVEFSLTYQLELQIGDRVYFGVRKTEDDPGLSYNVASQWNTTIEIEQETALAASYCQGYRIIDVMNFVVQCITGKANAVRSSFFGSNAGAGWAYILTNGFQIRNFDVDNKPMVISWKDVIDCVAPIWNLGVQLTEADGVPVVMVEHFDELFKGGRIHHIEESYDYEERHAAEHTYNEIEIGYQKFPEEELNTLDEFNTKQTWLTPIKTYKAKLSRMSKAIASGRLIEITRREQFKTNPSTSMTNDDETFIIAIAEVSTTYSEIDWNTNGMVFAGSRGLFTSNKALALDEGEKFKLIKSGNNPDANKVFTVIKKMIGAPQDIYLISPKPSTQTGTGGAITVILDTPRAERNEHFTVTAGVLSPETAYNLRISPKRNLLNHATLINVGLHSKLASEQLKNTYVKSNGELQTKFNETALHKLVDDNYTIKENAALPLAEMQRRRKPFIAITCTFKCKLRYDHFSEIIKALRGVNESVAKNFGVITHYDLKGELWESVIYSIDFDPGKNVATFEVRKKRKI